MKKYILILLGGNNYRFEIDEKLDKALKSALKDNYKFDENNYLIIDQSDSVLAYKNKQKLYKIILDQIDKYDLNIELTDKLKSLKSYVNTNKTTVYNSDLVQLENLLSDAMEVYASVKNNTLKADKTSVEKALDEFVVSNDKNKEIISDFRDVIDDISKDNTLRNDIATSEIKEAFDKIIVCASKDEYEEKTGKSFDSFGVDDAIKALNKNETIILPPNVEIEKVLLEITQVYCSKEELEKIVDFVENSSKYKNEVTSAFDNLRSSLKVSGVNGRNLNYFGDQFLDQFMQICESSGTSFETMFEDYFNSYSENKKYNSALDRFIRQFIKFNGGDENTRSLLEAMIVKKAIARNLISNKYNRYLSEDFRDMKFNGSGFIYFNDKAQQVLNNSGGFNISFNIAESFGSSTTGASLASAGGRGFATDSSNLGINGSVNAENNTNLETNVKDSLQFQENDEDMLSFTVGDKNKNTNLMPNDNGENTIVGNINDKQSLQAKMASARANRIRGTKAKVAKAGGVLGASAALNSEREIDETSIGSAFTTNHSMNPAFYPDDSENEDNYGSDSDEKSSDLEKGADNDSMPEDNASNIGNNVSPVKEVADAAKKIAKKEALKILMKHPLFWAVVIGGGVFLLIILLLIMGGNDDQQIGYMDRACNFNETNVTVTNCYADGNDKEVLYSLDLKDYVLGATYAYSYSNNYSDEVLKAMMVVLKTNALSYGGYSSGTKDIEVKSCSQEINYCSLGGCNTTYEGFYSGVLTYKNNVSEVDVVDTIPEISGDYKQKLSSLYEEVSNYLYVSSSYQSTISSLSSQNIINFDENKIREFVTIESDFSQILDTVYRSDITDEEETVYRDTFFIGDSRTRGMQNAGLITNTNTVYGIGLGYNWFVGSGTYTDTTTNALSGAIVGANSKMRVDASYNVIIWLGINDINIGADTYYQKYYELATGEWSEHNIYVVAIGPVDDEKTLYVENSDINTFNQNMKSLIQNGNISNLKYIDLGLDEDSISSYDSEGLHYGSDDYKKIYDIIMANVSNEISANLSLYNLTDYCTYYNVTENDAYWWPIGSANATTGNIYGGAPMITQITSPFGWRRIGGELKNHRGIDISGGGPACYSNVIIAAKDGVVSEVNNGCSTIGSYGNKCGGTYGNYITIDHGDGMETRYAHLSLNTIEVEVGDKVVQGQKLALMGSSGSSTGCHLHFEVILNGTRVNPSDYVDLENPRPIQVSSISDIEDGANASENKELICKALLDSGYSKNATAAILVNMAHEGSFQTTNLENCYEEGNCCTSSRGNKYGYCMRPQLNGFGSDSLYTNGVDTGAYTRENFINDSAGYGLIQWTSSGRKEKLYDYAKSQNKSIGSLSVQFEYLMTEIEGYPVTYKYLTGNYSAYDITNNFCLDFERPDNKVVNCANRAANDTEKYLQFVNNGCS